MRALAALAIVFLAWAGPTAASEKKPAAAGKAEPIRPSQAAKSEPAAKPPAGRAPTAGARPGAKPGADLARIVEPAQPEPPRPTFRRRPVQRRPVPRPAPAWQVPVNVELTWDVRIDPRMDDTRERLGVRLDWSAPRKPQ